MRQGMRQPCESTLLYYVEAGSRVNGTKFTIPNWRFQFVAAPNGVLNARFTTLKIQMMMIRSEVN
ncbi:hypothetical protein DAPPUDRAFT_260989 [Daphnia pulex]|uniref:Uncharacterized protein n=1 Tax=Daphnia pulex TaxID=6669 RepID=E9HKA9_DAPPU|nr:hypothetical protein DAPPUDRAFT_260989 [Daphnia pulex]|eukprot:EFX67853.1 hypothetical protein DAPPUDRAFT_260989 [Daphnia pulex]